MASSGLFRRVALVRTGVSVEFSAYIIRVTRIGFFMFCCVCCDCGSVYTLASPTVMSCSSCCVVLCGAVLCGAVLCCVVLCCVVLFAALICFSIARIQAKSKLQSYRVLQNL
jgi:hypothetical protein